MRPEPDHLLKSSLGTFPDVVSALSAICIAGMLLFTSSSVSAGQDEGASLPGLEAVTDLGTLVGEWSMSGLAGKGSEENSAGRMFRARQSIQWIEPGRSLGVVWSVMLEDGSVITSGRGRINWDDIAGAVVNTYRGEEDGRPFTGSATLIAASDGVFDWRGHETFGTSESVNFEVTYAFPNDDLCTVDFIPTCVDGDVELDPARFSWSRVNPFQEAMPFASDLLGDWALLSGGSDFIPDGSRMAIRSGRGGRSLSFVVSEPGENGDFIGTEILWLDDATGDLGIRMIASDGSVRVGAPSIDRRNGRSALQVVWAANVEGDRSDDQEDLVSMVSWLTVEEDRIEVVFAFLDAEGRAVPDDSRPSMIWQRPAS